MRFTRLIGTFLTCIILLFTCLIPVFASVNSSNNDIIVETNGYVPDNVSCEWEPNYANELPSDFPNDWVDGTDDRTTVSNTTAKPYLSIAALKVTYPSGTAVGTGFMVSKNCMITAGHLLIGLRALLREKLLNQLIYILEYIIQTAQTTILIKKQLLPIQHYSTTTLTILVMGNRTMTMDLLSSIVILNGTLAGGRLALKTHPPLWNRTSQ